ncbi:hypothetical protein AOLI_G00319500 [Acnodon oligacanthus]
MELIQPGPWAKLPPAPPPAPTTHPASIPSLSQLWLSRWSTPSNPFEEEKEEDKGPKNDGTYKACIIRSSQSWCSASQLADAASVNSKCATGIVKFPEVQAEGYMHEEDLQRQQGVLEDRLQELERQGEELEKKIHNSTPGKQEEELLVDWFTLIHEKHTLVRRDAELVYILKQQELEQKQADVEFQLRSLLNKPEREWTRDDEIREQKLTFELVAIIEQRNDIISSQEKDRQREQEEDDLLDTVIKKRDFYRQVRPQLLSFGGKLKALRVLKMLKALKARGSNRKEKRSSSISLS